MKKVTDTFLQISYFISTPTFIHSLKKIENTSVNRKLLDFHVTSRNHVIKEPCGFMGGSFSQEVITL